MYPAINYQLPFIKNVAELDAEVSARLLQAIVIVEQSIGEVVCLQRNVVLSALDGIHQVGILAPLVRHIQFGTLTCP